jgi:hypothetical protein
VLDLTRLYDLTEAMNALTIDDMIMMGSVPEGAGPRREHPDLKNDATGQGTPPK